MTALDPRVRQRWRAWRGLCDSRGGQCDPCRHAEVLKSEPGIKAGLGFNAQISGAEAPGWLPVNHHHLLNRNQGVKLHWSTTEGAAGFRIGWRDWPETLPVVSVRQRDQGWPCSR